MTKYKTLLGERNIDFSISCLSSFVHNSKSKITLQIFEDGSLTPQGIDKLHTAFEDCQIIYRNEREAKILEKLQNYAHCKAYRDSSIYTHKLFDIALYASEDIYFLDSDVFFISQFKLPDFGGLPCFMWDKQNAYSFHPQEFASIPYPIFPRINTGFFYFPIKAFDLDFLEELLIHPQIKKGIGRISWLEQTLWAFLSGTFDQINYFDKNQIVMARQKLKVTPVTVGVHLVSTYRDNYDSLTAKIVENGSFKDLKLTAKNKYMSTLEFAQDRFKKSIYRRLNLDL